MRGTGTPFAVALAVLITGMASTSAFAADRFYTVKPGDTLSTIAQNKLGSVRHMNALRKANPRIRNIDHIRVGQRLRIPPVTPGKNTTPHTSAYYTVKSGDTLSAIALKTLRSAKRTSLLLAANPKIKNKNLIRIGMKLRIPKLHHTPQSKHRIPLEI